MLTSLYVVELICVSYFPSEISLIAETIELKGFLILLVTINRLAAILAKSTAIIMIREIVRSLD